MTHIPSISLSLDFDHVIIRKNECMSERDCEIDCWWWEGMWDDVWVTIVRMLTQHHSHIEEYIYYYYPPMNERSRARMREWPLHSSLIPTFPHPFVHSRKDWELGMIPRSWNSCYENMSKGSNFQESILTPCWMTTQSNSCECECVSSQHSWSHRFFHLIPGIFGQCPKDYMNEWKDETDEVVTFAELEPGVHEWIASAQLTLGQLHGCYSRYPRSIRWRMRSGLTGNRIVITVPMNEDDSGCATSFAQPGVNHHSSLESHARMSTRIQKILACDS